MSWHNDSTSTLCEELERPKMYESGWRCGGAGKSPLVLSGLELNPEGKAREAHSAGGKPEAMGIGWLS